MAFTMTSPEAPDPEDASTADASRPVSRWAIAAFLLGVVSLVPLSVIAGIVALAKARDGRESGRGLAIAGIVISVLWGAVWFYRDRKSTRLNSSHREISRMPSSA